MSGFHINLDGYQSGSTPLPWFPRLACVCGFTHTAHNIKVGASWETLTTKRCRFGSARQCGGVGAREAKT